ECIVVQLVGSSRSHDRKGDVRREQQPSQNEPKAKYHVRLRIMERERPRNPTPSVIRIRRFQVDLASECPISQKLWTIFVRWRFLPLNQRWLGPEGRTRKFADVSSISLSTRERRRSKRSPCSSIAGVAPRGRTVDTNQPGNE